MVTLTHDFITDPELAELARCGHNEQLREKLCERIDKEPDNAKVFGWLGTVELELGNIPEAIELFSRAMQLGASDVVVLLGLGKALHKARRFEEAAELYKNGLVQHPDSAEIHNQFGRALNNLGALTQARRAFERSVRLKPDFAEAQHNVGHVRQRLGDSDGAFEAFIEALRLDPDYASAHYNLGVVHLSRNELKHAEDCFRQAIALNPEHLSAHAHLGASLIQQRRFDEACKFLGDAVSSQTQNFDLWANYGIALSSLARNDEAVRAFEKAHSIDSSDPLVVSHYASALVAVDRKDDAVAVTLPLLDDAPNEPDEVTADGFWHLGEVVRAAGRLDLAIQCYGISTRAAAHEAKGRVYLGAALMEAGDLSEALDSLDRALALNPLYQSGIACKVALLERLGRTAEARALLDLDRFVMYFDLAPPTGYSHIDAFNRALTERALSETSLEFERGGNATRLGFHSDSLDIKSEGPLRSLTQAIDSSVRQYLDALPFSLGHPLLGRRPSRWALQVWTVIMQRGGYQIPHTHDEGFLSGVYYPSLPDVISASDASHEGWLEVGRPTENLLGTSEPEVKLIQPRQGRLIIFPSYCFHRTVPFDSDGTRVSIAFDLIPQEWEPEPETRRL